MAPFIGKEQSSACNDGRNDEPDSGHGNYNIDNYRAYGTGALKYPADEVETPYTVQAPIDRTEQDKNVRNKIKKYHINFLLTIVLPKKILIIPNRYLF